MRVGAFLLVAVTSLTVPGCGSPERVDVSGIVRDGRSGRALAGAVIAGTDGAEGQADEAGRFTIQLPVGDGRVVRAATARRCPGDAEVDVSRGTDPVTVHLFPRLEVEAEHLQVGFDSEVRIEVSTRCDPNAPVRWRQTAGRELGSERMRVEDGGRVLIVKTHPLSEMVTLSPVISTIPLSRHERAEYRFELEAELGGVQETRDVRVTAAATSAGAWQVPTGVDLYLNGGDDRESWAWEIVEAPDGSEAELVHADTRTPHFRPDVFGAYFLRPAEDGVDVLVMAGPYETVPRDCGRVGCHRPEDHGWQTTAHARTFRRGLTGDLGPDFDEACWTCHATGVDPGVDNGGLHATARRRQWTQPEPSAAAFETAPRIIRDQGSVWCSSCHGPGRILPPQYHWEYQSKFQAGICAQCHDAVDDPDSPHQSWQYREWARAPMATFVGGPMASSGPATRRVCASCHSAQGFVGWLDTGDHPPPEEEFAVAITCTACHDPHDAANPRALRTFEDVDDVGGSPAAGLGAGAVCASCHRSGIAETGGEDASAAPHAPQADVLLGRGSQLVRRPREPGVHANLAGSCVACHMARPAEDDPMLGRAGGHTFSVRDLEATGPRPILSRAACSGCHGNEVPPQAIGGYEDRDGDGRADNVGQEFDRAIAETRATLRERIGQARVSDECPAPRLAQDFVERDAMLVLTDGANGMLGDCDGDGLFAEGERPVGVGMISRELRKVIWDVVLLQSDGSHGRHNPGYTFEILRAVRRQLGP